MKTTLKALGAALLVALAASAAAPPIRPPALTREADQLDYAYFGSDGPVLIRLHIRCGERPYDAAWSDYMDKLFAWFDKDNDGALSAAEVGRIPQANIFQNQIAGGIGNSTTGTAMSQVDANKDGVVSRGEFKAYYRNGGVRPLQFSFDNSQATTSKQINDAMYKRLDKDGDGKLTEAELARLPQLLGPLDENEDELLTAGELNTTANSGMNVFAVRTRMGGRQANLNEQGLIELPDAAAAKRLAPQILTKYDKNKNGKLAKEEIKFSDDKLFDALDKNRDCNLDAAELTAWFDREPDLGFRLRVGATGPVSGFLSRIGLSNPATPNRAEVFNPKGRSMPLASRVNRANGDNLTFTLGDTRFALQGSQGQVNVVSNGIREFLLTLFDSALDQKKGYLTKDQEKDNRQQPFVFQMFRQADKNADDKLTRAEFVSWLDLVNEGNVSYVSLQVSDMGRGVFEVMDTDGSQSLSIRETRTAWQRLKPLTKDGMGLAVADLPRTMRVAASQGNPAPPQQFFVFGGMQPQQTKGAPSDAPLWFRKMDTNKDSDISPKEWLGTDEEFRAIDTDGDGLLSMAEARSFELKRKAAKK